MFAIVLVVQDHLHLLEALLQAGAIGLSLNPQAGGIARRQARAVVAPAAPIEKSLRQISAALPLAAIDQPLQPGSIGPGRRAVHPPPVTLAAGGGGQGIVSLALV